MKGHSNSYIKTLYILIFITLIVMFIGVSYSYYTKKILGGDNTRVIIKTADILIKYYETNIIESYDISPGWSDDFEFVLENFSPNVDAEYKISLEIISPLTEEPDENFVFSLTGKTESKDEIIKFDESKVPIKTKVIGSTKISAGAIHSYKLNFQLIDNNLNQNYLQGKKFIGRISVESVF